MIFEKLSQKIRVFFKFFPIIQSVLNFLFRFSVPSNIPKQLKHGICPLCGKKTLMLIESINLRETGFCLFCSSNTRYKVMAEILKRLIIIRVIKNEINHRNLKDLINRIELYNYSFKSVLKQITKKDFWIYEPSSAGAIYNYLKKYHYFLFSEFFPYSNFKSGQFYMKIRHEDLQSLSFKDNSIDIIITQDIFEHIKHPTLAFKEIYRVLKKNGIHIFTTPIKRGKTEFLIQSTNQKYHVDPLRPEGAIVYTQFGTDIVEVLNEHNFHSFFINLKKNPKLGIFTNIYIIISIKN